MSATDQPEPPPPLLGAVLGPLPLWATAALLGAGAGEVLGTRLLPVAGHLVLLAGLSGLGLLAVAVGLSVRQRPRPVVGAGLLALLAVLLVAAAGSVARVGTTTLGALPGLAAQGGRASLEVTVVHEPRPIATGWHVLLRVDAIDGVATRERVAATLEEDPPALGTRWQVQATARPLPDGGYGRWLARQHATVAIDVHGWQAAAGAGRLAATSEHVRQRVREAAGARLPDRLAGLLAGFVTGDTRRLPEADAEAMRATSLTHLTAVSGSNVAIVTGGVLGACLLLRVGAGARRVVLAVTVAWFALVTRFEPSVLRAGTMALLLLLAGARGVPRDARHALAGAVLLLVLLDPALAGSLGLLLSATATAGVLVVAPRVRDRLVRLPRRLAEVVGITVGAQVAVVPLLLATFGEVPMAALPANVLAVPAAALAATTAFVGTVVALVWPELGGWVFALAGQPARVVLLAAHAFAEVGGLARTTQPATVAALLAACAWVLARPGGRAARICAVLTVLALVVAAVPRGLGALPPRTLTVTAIDVGQGDAFLVESPAARILVDAGEDGTAAQWLRDQGRRHLDLVIVTHPHLDHIGGVPAVLGAVRVGAVWLRPLPTELPHPEVVLSLADEQGIVVRDPVAGDRARIGDLDLEVLGPPPGRPYRASRSELNDTSIVVRITHRGRRVLLAGDVEQPAQADLLARPELLRAEVLAVPHHGSSTTDPAFLAAVAPRIGLVSAGVDNRHGHPADETLAILDELGVEVRRTDLEGSIRVEVPPPLGAAAHVAPACGASLPRHGLRAPAHRRRPARAARARTPARGAHGRGPGRRGGPLRRLPARAAAGASHRVAVRWAHDRGDPRGAAGRGGAARRARGLRRRPLARRGAGAAGNGHRGDPQAGHDRQAARRARGRAHPTGLRRPGLGPDRRGGVPPAAAQGGCRGDRRAARPRRGGPRHDRRQGRHGVRGR